MNLEIKIIEKTNRYLTSKRGLLYCILIIFFANISIYHFSKSTSFSSDQSRKDASAFTFYMAKKFVYFYYYTGYFPLATQQKKIQHSKEKAFEEIEERGEDLIMEYYHWSRLGENSRIFAFLPNAWIDGGVKKPSIKLFNVLVFILGLALLFFGFWKVKKPLLGLVLVFLINTTPFYLYEVFTNQNVFGVLPSSFFMILGLNLVFLFSYKIDFYYKILIPIISAFIIGFFSEIRNEISIVLASLLLIYLLSKQLSIVFKIYAVFLTIFIFSGTKQSLRNYFKTKFNETAELVSSKNGHLYTGGLIEGHMVWHPIFCGLGDFDTKYGYAWNDMVAFDYAMPILNSEHKLNLKYKGGYHLDKYYDKDKLYYVKFDEIPEYEPIIKEKVLSDIKNDPLWFAEIIWKRIIRVFSRTLPFQNLGFIMLLLLSVLIYKKKWHWIKLLVVSLPLSATSIVVFSGRGTTYNSVFGYFVVLIIIYEVFLFFNKRVNNLP